MPALSERKIEIVRTLVEAAPDAVVGNLQKALEGTGEDTALASVRRLVETEARDRRLRNAILKPIAPMCQPGREAYVGLTFPSRALALVWRALKATAAAKVAQAEQELAELEAGQPAPLICDVLTVLAATGLRAREPHAFRLAAEFCDQARPNGAEQLAACLDLAQVVRAAGYRLGEWIAHAGEETTAGCRLAFKDAVAVADDAGTRFFEMLAAQLEHPWMVLRIISAVMDKPTERYLADSELAGFGARVLDRIDEDLEALDRLDPNAGPAAGRAAGRRVETITHLTTEVETCMTLSREHGWGKRLAKQKQTLAEVVEARLRDADRQFALALPTQTARLARIRKSVPRLTAMPDEAETRRAMTLLSFIDEVRSAANYGGFAAARGKLLDKLGDALDQYVEEVLDHLRTEEPEDPAIGYAFLALAADLARLVQGDKAADLIRRRTAALHHEENPPAAKVG